MRSRSCTVFQSELRRKTRSCPCSWFSIVASILACSLSAAGPRGHHNRCRTGRSDVIFPKHPGTGRMKPTPPLVAELKLWEEDSRHTTRQVSAAPVGCCPRVGSSSWGLLQDVRMPKQPSRTSLPLTLTKFLQGRASPGQRPLSGFSHLTVPI